MSADPIGFAGGDPTLYAYVANNPISRIDPLGLWGWGFGIIGSGSAEAGIGAVGAGATRLAGGGVFGGVFLFDPLDPNPLPVGEGTKTR